MLESRESFLWMFICVLGIFLGVLIQYNNTQEERDLVNSLKSECEMKLPRDQECVMVFIAPDELVVKRSTLGVGDSATKEF